MLKSYMDVCYLIFRFLTAFDLLVSCGPFISLFSIWDNHLFYNENREWWKQLKLHNWIAGEVQEIDADYRSVVVR